MVNEKKDPGGIGLQIEAPTPCASPAPQPSIWPDRSMALHNLPKPLTLEEKKYLLSVERGDLPNVRRILQRAHRRQHIEINCVDSLGRGALTIAIDGENLEMVELLVIMGVQTKDALLQAINAEFVEAVELLLEHEELIHADGEPYSWQKVEMNTSMFTSDITPLILAAHRNNYEILKILLDRGATIPMPHDIKCGCDDCIRDSTEDSLRHSLSRVNEYRALASPSLIALSSNDPLLTAFQLSWELRNLAFAEQECKSEYLDLRRQCQTFAVDLLHQSRSSKELAIILNHDPDAPPYEDGDHMKLARLELAINYKQKKFVAHPNIQQLLASLWYEGVPGFRRKGSMEKLFIILRVALLFPLYCMIYMVAPNCRMGIVLKKPFMKFLVHASSYLFFLGVLILVSQRAEVHLIQMFGTASMKQTMEEELRRQRGNGPTALELLVVFYVLGFIWEETQEIYMEGMKNYLRNMWNFIDFSRNFLYCLVGILRVVAYIQQRTEIRKDPETAFIAREHWADYDPQLIAEGLFAAANIFSALKLVHLFSINPHLGPLQISLGRMVIDIVKFFFIYSLVLFAFACGLNQLLWYFADLEKQKCYTLPGGEADWDNSGDSCMKWRRFGNLFESSQSLFWASFGMVGLESFELEGIKSYTRFWGLLMFGSYSVINVIVLLNLLIAMMSNSYAMITEHADTEWKFARTKLWMSYFDDGATLPPPFNILPSVKWFTKLCKTKKDTAFKRGSTIRRKEDRENRYLNIMRSLVWRYVSAKHRKDDENAVTEDDINEVKCDISAMRYEMLEIFERNGMDISSADKKEKANLGKKMKIWERRLMKDFQVAPVAVEEENIDQQNTEEKGIARFRRIAKQVVDQTTSHRWGVAVKGIRDTQIGRCHNRESFKNQQNLQRAINEAKKLIERGPQPGSRSCSPVEYFDPQSNTLLELLRNISEENDDFSPDTNSLEVIGKGSPSISPAATLSRKLQSMEAAQATRGPMGSTSIRLKPKTTTDAKTITNLEVTSSTDILTKRSQPLDHSENCARKILPKGTASAATTHRRVCQSSAVPSIQISRSESQLVMKVKSGAIDSTDKDEPMPLISSAANSAPKVVKRKAPSNPISGSPEKDISISRPVASKAVSGQGLIPPPPTATPSHLTETLAENPSDKSKSEIKTTCFTKEITNNIIDVPTVLCISKADLSKDASIPHVSLSDQCESGPEFMMSSLKAKGLENLIQTEKSDSSRSRSPSPSTTPSLAPSPKCLRPYRKIDDVTTVKRQPKTGWL